MWECVEWLTCGPGRRGREGGEEGEESEWGRGGGQDDDSGWKKKEVNVIAILFVLSNYEEQCCVTLSCRLNVCCTQASKR